MKQYLLDYFGYVYLWFDRKNKMYYIGSHYGSVEDSYICSNKWMKAAYKKRPQDFKMRVLKYLEIDDLKLLQQYEQHYLNMILDSELSTSANVIAGCNRYYNMKKYAAGGNGDANKGKVRVRMWNAQEWEVVDPQGKVYVTSTLYKFCKEHNLSKDTLWLTLKEGRPAMRGKAKGWMLKKNERTLGC